MQPAFGINRARIWLSVTLVIGLAGCGDSLGPAKSASDGVLTEPVVVSLPELTRALPSEVGAAASDELQAIFRRVDPSVDDNWQSEVFTVRAQSMLDDILAGKPNVGADFRCRELRPRSLTTAYTDSLTQVFRDGEQPAADSRALEGRTGLEAALLALREPFTSEAKIKAKAKIFRVEETDGGLMKTEALYAASGPGEHGTVQQNARWIATWRVAETVELLELKAADFSEVRSVAEGGLVFEDITAAVFAGNSSFTEQLARGIDHWRGQLQGDFGNDVNGMEGIALGDANGDGLDDIYVCQQGGLPNRLYLRNADGTLRDVSAESGTDWMEVTRAALLVDLDNDGDEDLVLAQGWYWMLMRNDGDAHFTKMAEQRAPANLHSLAAADYDLDGDLDIFFCGRNPGREFQQSEGLFGQPIPYHDANNGGANVLLRNDGNWQFKDVTASSGLDVNNRRYSYACSWEDYDGDGDPDLYVANDFGRNNLYQNNNGSFRDVAGDLGVEDMSAGMGVTWGDYNNDGHPDLYVSNMFSKAGNRITYQRQFRAGMGGENAPFQRHARGNSLFAGMPSGRGFADVSESACVTMGRWAWGAKFVDLNNDGWEDLVVANGFITTPDTGDL